MGFVTKARGWTVKTMSNTLAAEFAICMIKILQNYVVDVIECDCYRCPFYNNYHCLLSGCLGQNDADSLLDNLEVFSRRMDDGCDAAPIRKGEDNAD